MQGMKNHLLTGKDTGNYRVDRLLSQGSLSNLYEAYSHSGQRVMLISFSLSETSSAQIQANFLTRFMQEGAALSQLKHSAIVPIYDYGECSGYPYLITPFVSGSSLAQIQQSRGRFSIEEALPILRQVADGLDYAHLHGILHGSLSSATIVQKKQGTMQIAGFGLMHILARQHFEQGSGPDTEALYNAKLFVGTPGRMAPEIMGVALGQNVPFDARVDTYALGIQLFELVSGRLPFTGATPPEVAQQPIPSLAALNPTLPAAIDTVIQKALARQPEQRFQSAREFIQALEQARSTQFENANRFSIQPHDAPTIASDFDPFVRWTNTSPIQPASRRKPVRTASRAGQKAQQQQQERRKVVALLAGGGVVALIGLAGGTIALANTMQSHAAQVKTASTQAQNSAATIPTQTSGATTPTQTSGAAAPTQSPAPTGTGTTNPAPTTPPQPGVTPPAGGAAPAPTQPPPAPVPTAPPQPTGTVIGSTSMAVNTAKNFTDPASGNASVLIHLPNGNFVAYSTSCTHKGVPVNYDPASSTLICPAHGATFDPANNAAVTVGPATTPLAAVTIHVNADGTITAI